MRLSRLSRLSSVSSVSRLSSLVIYTYIYIYILCVCVCVRLLRLLACVHGTEEEECMRACTRMEACMHVI